MSQPHLLLLYLAFLLCDFDKTTGYRLKLAGDDELYVAKIKNSIRVVKSTDINDIKDLNSVFKLEKDRGGKYIISFCGDYLSTKYEDPGIIPTKDLNDLTDWELREVEGGFQLVNRGYCLVRMDSFDDKLRGYYMNSQKCNKNYRNVFSILNAGKLGYFCPREMDHYCKDLEECVGNGKRPRPEWEYFGDEPEDQPPRRKRSANTDQRPRYNDRYQDNDPYQRPESRRDGPSKSGRDRYYEPENRPPRRDRGMPDRSVRGGRGPYEDSESVDTNRPGRTHHYPDSEDFYHHHS